MAKQYSRSRSRALRWSVTAALGLGMLGGATAAWAASPVAEPTLPPVARAQAERTAMLTTRTATPGNFEPAPTPNQDILSPRGIVSTGVEVGPSMFSPKSFYRGDGYTQGSSQQVLQEPRRMPLPGISLKVPLN